MIFFCGEKLNILLTRSMLDKDVEYIKRGLDKEIAGRYDLVIPCSFDEAVLAEEAKNAHVLLGPFVCDKIMQSAEKLSLIQVPWTGLDTFNFCAVRGYNVTVCNTHSNSSAVAEMGIALLLDLLKKVSFHDRKMRQGSWNRDCREMDLTSKQLSNQCVCILGCGNIGYKLAQIINAFGAGVIAVDDYRTADEVVSEVYGSESFIEALEKADIVMSALPLTEKTRGLINSEAVDHMRNGVTIVNVSRADIMEENAIFNGLRSGKIAGFASDVWWKTPKRGESESYPSESNEFWKMNNVVMSPHRAGFIENSLPHLDGAIENIINLVMGRELKCKVDIEKHF